jgi:hypothetical protein
MALERTYEKIAKLVIFADFQFFRVIFCDFFKNFPKFCDIFTYAFYTKVTKI